jgi:hypothetical protein
MGVLLATSGGREDVMPPPCRLGCSPDVFVGASGLL